MSVRDDAEQAAWVADEVLAQREQGIALKRQAVLFRTSHHSAALELELTRRNIPFVKFGGLKFLEAAHVKDLLSLLRWSQNPRHRLAGFRVAQLVPGMGPAGARQAARRYRTGDRRQGRAVGLPAAARRSGGVERAARLPGRRWPDPLPPGRRRSTWRCTGTGRNCSACTKTPRCGRLDLEQLQRLAGGYASREAFLAELTLDPPEATSDEAGPPHLDEDYLILSTIHSAKGQEWAAVYVLNVVDGCMPADMATGSAAEIEEERRLLYVAMTRAQQRLQLLVPQRFYVTQQAARGDRHLWGGLSRFIPPAVAAHFDRRSVQHPPAQASAAAAGPVLDLGARLRSIWN